MKKRRGQKSGSSLRIGFLLVLLLTVAVAVVWFSHNQRPIHSARATPTDRAASAEKIRHGHIELPQAGLRDTIVFNSEGRYAFGYAPVHRQPQWVAYKLTNSDIGGPAGRSGSFRVDARLGQYGWRSATNDDYRNSGYDKGHLLPSADRSQSIAENRETFLFSNIAPQLPALNRGAWKQLEEELRGRTRDWDTLYIVTGSVFGNEKALQIGSGVAVPELFFKAVAFRRGERFEQQGYVMPNRTGVLSGRDYAAFRVTVDSVERLTGLRFFPALR